MYRILCRPETFGRLIKWALEFEEFEVFYRPRTIIIGQGLADFLIEFTYTADLVEEVIPVDLPPDLEPAIPTWVLYVNGSSNK